MSEFKGTPGPWMAQGAGYAGWRSTRTRFEGGYLGVIRNEEGKYIYRGPSSFHALKGDTEESAIANAHLIAAAPELLEALIGVFQDEARSYNGNPDEWKTYAGPKSLAAIAKALGNE